MEAAKYDLNYIGLSGNIGCMGERKDVSQRTARGLRGEGRVNEDIELIVWGTVVPLCRGTRCTSGRVLFS